MSPDDTQLPNALKEAKTTARDSPFPSFIEPCLPRLTVGIPQGADWLHEIKYDGYRTQAHLKEGTATLYTRRGHDWTARYGTLAQALSGFPAKTAILDGEVVVPDEKGIPDFEALYADLAGNRMERLIYYVFDLLYLNGQDLRRMPLIDRKRLLWELTTKANIGRLRYSEHLEGSAEAMFEHACRMRLEGVVSKRQDSRYSSGRSETWLKIKCVKRDTFPIIAFVEKLGASPRKIASLYVGRWEGGRLLYAGKARSGYTEEVARNVRERLDPLIIKHSPLSVPVKKPKATWVKPEVEAEIAYSSVTADGILREAVFRGIREDLASSGQ